jgi:hypothetical protein
VKTYVVKREGDIRICGVQHYFGEQFGADESLQEIKNLVREKWIEEIKEAKP